MLKVSSPSVAGFFLYKFRFGVFSAKIIPPYNCSRNGAKLDILVACRLLIFMALTSRTSR
ncbi:hypothetical protein D3C71_2206910 [compost metagenome]